MTNGSVPAPRRRVTHTQAARLLAERDPVVAWLLSTIGPPRLRPPQPSHFEALVRSIVYQQLAGAAAAAIHGRLVAALDGDVRPETLLAVPDEGLRAVGLSANKATSLQDLATKVLDGTVVLSPRGLAREPDDEVVARLSTVRGVGRWTAEMFLLFQLRRLDVWPTGDLGVRRGFGIAWDLPDVTPRQLEGLGEPFRPYRSVVAWYCWRAADRAGRPSTAAGGPAAPAGSASKGGAADARASGTTPISPDGPDGPVTRSPRPARRSAPPARAPRAGR